MADLAGKTVLVTGASSGLGEQLALAVAAQGANVVLAARRRERLTQVADQCRILSQQQAIAITCDVSRVTAVDQVFATIDDLFGRLDVVINAAGFGDMTNVVGYGSGHHGTDVAGQYLGDDVRESTRCEADGSATRRRNRERGFDGR
nr:SDR family NAD(P)-dependent oxidoreductase [Lactiplantibacillus pentosus]